jgi:predicted amidophosphoribosyltransferase
MGRSAMQVSSTEVGVSLTEHALNVIYVCLRLTSVLFERGCAACRTTITSRTACHDLPGVCAACADQLTPPPARSVGGLDRVVAVAEYAPVMASILQSIKLGRRPELLLALARPLATLLRPNASGSTIVTWVPASPRGRRARGFDQGRILGVAVARELGLEARPAFRRGGPAQRGADRTERLRGPHLHVRADWVRRPPTAQVIVVDDVITTGSSLAAAARAIRRREPVELIGGAIASKP